MSMPSEPRPDVPLSPNWHIRLRQILDTYFDENDIKTLCFDLRLDYESLEGAGKTGKIVELMRQLAREGRIEELIDACSQQRPNVPWSELRDAAAKYPLGFASGPLAGESDEEGPVAPALIGDEGRGAPNPASPKGGSSRRQAAIGILAAAAVLLLVVAAVLIGRNLAGDTPIPTPTALSQVTLTAEFGAAPPTAAPTDEPLPSPTPEPTAIPSSTATTAPPTATPTEPAPTLAPVSRPTVRPPAVAVQGCTRTLAAADAALARAVPALGCPKGQAVATDMARQRFEHGQMIWRSDAAAIYVLAENGTWQEFADKFKEGDVESDPALTPPAGRFQPIRGFGKVWREALGAANAAIGWAVEEKERGTPGTAQEWEDAVVLKLDGTTFVLLNDGTWGVV